MTTALLPPPTADLTRRRLLRDAATLLVVTACAPTGEVDTVPRAPPLGPGGSSTHSAPPRSPGSHDGSQPCGPTWR